MLHLGRKIFSSIPIIMRKELYLFIGFIIHHGLSESGFFPPRADTKVSRWRSLIFYIASFREFQCTFWALIGTLNNLQIETHCRTDNLQRL